eukprot:6475113-Amphidinium_carterae.3
MSWKEARGQDFVRALLVDDCMSVHRLDHHGLQREPVTGFHRRPKRHPTKWGHSSGTGQHGPPGFMARYVLRMG